jgi:ribose transport system permease protein
VVLGGTALAGGFGNATGSIIGALVLGMIGNVIFFAGLPFEYQTLVQGLIVLAALAGGVFVTRR